MNINFELYKTYYYVCKELSFSKAADKLFVSQSAVSQSIKSLENQLGTPLFYRKGRNISLTAEGQGLLDYIEQAFNFIKSGETYLENVKSLDSGTIYLGASDTISKYVLIPYLKKFNVLYPKVKISINNRSSTRSIELIKKGNIDLAIINVNPFISYSSFDVYNLSDEDNVLIYSPDKYTFEKPLSLKKAFEYPIICLEKDSTTRTVLDYYLSDNKIVFIPYFEFGSLDVILEMTRVGMGLGYVSRNIAEDYLKNGLVKEVPLNKKLPSNSVAIITNKNKPLSLATQKFLSILTS